MVNRFRVFASAICTLASHNNDNLRCHSEMQRVSACRITWRRKKSLLSFAIKVARHRERGLKQ
jgi:hypothetical protein